jgi:succinate dehydrogenase / fumarate reductase cytochrome b subunit
MWLTSSSIGKKLVMAITGACLVLFVTFHVLMNAVAIVWPASYNAVCEFLGANWYALIASAGLGLLFVIHIIYAVCLTIQNRNARGNQRYTVNSRPASVEWSSKNMLVLGIVVVAFLAIHMCQFWYKMQYQELCGQWYSTGDFEYPAASGTLFLQLAFEQWWTPIVYLIGFIALWFHLNHGFWSMFQTAGWNNNVWVNRLKSISLVWTSIVVVLFAIEAGVFTYQANKGTYLTDNELKTQYIEQLQNKAEEQLKELSTRAAAIDQQSPEAPIEFQKLQQEYQEINRSLQNAIEGLNKLGQRFTTPAEVAPAPATATEPEPQIDAPADTEPEQITTDVQN